MNVNIAQTANRIKVDCVNKYKSRSHSRNVLKTVKNKNAKRLTTIYIHWHI